MYFIWLFRYKNIYKKYLLLLLYVIYLVEFSLKIMLKDYSDKYYKDMDIF